MGAGIHGEFDPNAFGPFGPVFQTYVSALDNFSRTYGVPNVWSAEFNPNFVSVGLASPLKAAARSQLEVFGLLNRRTQAYLQAPTRLAQCRAPNDVVNEQMAFWRTAAEQYAEVGRKIFDAWSAADPRIAVEGSSGEQRDYINFNGNGAKDVSPRSDIQETQRQRRVA